MRPSLRMSQIREVVKPRPGLTSNEIADALNLPVECVNPFLVRMTRMGVLRRERGRADQDDDGGSVHDFLVFRLATAALAMRTALPSSPESLRTLFATEDHCFLAFGLLAFFVFFVASALLQGITVSSLARETIEPGLNTI